MVLSVFLGIALAAIVFTIVVFIHELGHFLAARFCRVKVEEFGMGLPPRLATLWKDRQGTLWTFNWLPIGGFVRLLGERREEGMAPQKGALWSRPISAQMMVVLAGVFFNFVLAFVILTGVFMVGVKPLGVNQQFAQVETALLPTWDQALREGILVQRSGAVLNPIKGSPAEKAGILAGDIAVKVGSTVINRPEDFIAALRSISGKTVQMELVSSGTTRSVTITLLDGKIGAYVGDAISESDFRYQLGFFPAVRLAAHETWTQTKLLALVLRDLVAKLMVGTPTERQEATQAVSGPVAIGDFFVQYVRVGSFDGAALMAIVALISLNLGMFNLLPLPALDGGRFAFLCVAAVAKIFRRDIVGCRLETWTHTIGFIFLLALAAAVTYKDIASIFLR